MEANQEMGPLDTVNTATSILLFVIGAYCLLTRRQVIKQVIGLKIMMQGVTLSLVHGARLHGETPIGETMAISALVVEAVVIAIALALIVNVFRHYPSGDIDDLSKLRG
jgi:NADH-quinone oxidoreductase subunit K